MAAINLEISVPVEFFINSSIGCVQIGCSDFQFLVFTNYAKPSFLWITLDQIKIRRNISNNGAGQGLV